MISEDHIDTEILCKHCGEMCESDSISMDDAHFCCLGCKTVFEILHENGLDAYYRLEDTPGNTLKNEKGNDQYQYLEDQKVQQQILDFQDRTIAKLRLYIPSIHCSSCIWLLENLYKLNQGILVSQVEFPKRTIRIDFNPLEISLREIVEMLVGLGYEPEITLENGPDKLTKGVNTQRRLLVKIGVTGFAFGNIMLFSFPDYIGMDRLCKFAIFRTCTL